jgi:hypothetical protein
MEVASGTATVSSYSDMVSGNASRQQIITLSSVFGNRDIFIFIKPTTESGVKNCGVWKYKVGTQWRFWFWSNNFPTNETIKYAIFVSGSTSAANTGYGLTVMTPSGDVGYSSERVNFRATQATMGVMSKNTSVGPLTQSNMAGVYGLYTGTNFVERFFNGPSSFNPNTDSMAEEGYQINWYHSHLTFNYSAKTITMSAGAYYADQTNFFVDKGGSSTRTLITGTRL